MYDERKENTYNSANRTMTGNLGNWLIDNYETVGTVSPDQQQQYADIADTAMAASWDDFNRQLAKGQAAANAGAYNRFGSLTNTPALYDQETFARQANSSATDLATAQYMNSLVNQDINRQLQSWKQYSNMYNTAGKDITELDKYNWNIRNQNKDRQYTNDVSDFQAKVARAQMLADMMDPMQKMMSQFQGSGGSGSGLFNSFNQFGGANSMGGFTDFMNNRYGSGSFSSSMSMPSNLLSDKYNWISSVQSGGSPYGLNVNDFGISNIDTSSPGWLGNVSANLGSSDTGSWLSSIGNWFKGLGGK